MSGSTVMDHTYVRLFAILAVMSAFFCTISSWGFLHYLTKDRYERVLAVSQNHTLVFITYYLVEEMWEAGAHAPTNDLVTLMDTCGSFRCDFYLGQQV